MYRSLSEFIALLEREGELLRIAAPVSPRFEIAEIADRMAKSPGGGKALLFERTGTPFPVVCNLYGSDRRMALALGCSTLEEAGERVETLLRSAMRPCDTFASRLRMLPLLGGMSRWLPRRRAGRGACQQVVRTGADASLAALPVLTCWPCDGGAFVTLPMVHTLDLQTGGRNVGMYRMQLFDERTAGMHWHVHKTGARHFEAYRSAGCRMPVAVTLGGDPAYAYAATAPLPDGMDEYLLAGFLRRRPVRLVRCLTNELCVPEDCDFVIEGYVDPAQEPAVEGPFGDHTGFYSLEDLYPRLHVTAITHRRDAVYPATLVGIPPMEDACISRATERIFLPPIRQVILPEAVDMTMPASGTSHNLAIVSIGTRYGGQPRKAAQSLWGAGQMMFNKYLLIVPARTDVRDAAQLASLVRRADPVRDWIADQGVLDVLDHATATPGVGGKGALDLTSVDTSLPLARIAPPAEPLAGKWGLSGSNESFLEQWGVWVLYAQADAEADVAACLRECGVRNVPFAVLFDAAAEGVAQPADLLWLAGANTDPRRDARIVGRTLVLDARSKRPGVEGHPVRFPNVVCSSEETIRLVDRRWAEYGAGDPLPSPSRRYRRLLLSDGAQW